MANKSRSPLYFVLAILLFLVLPFIWRKYRDNDIKVHRWYTFGKVIRKTGSLKNGHNWDYDFYFDSNLYHGYYPTHKDYDVEPGDYFLIEFSYKSPTHNGILYEYKLRPGNSAIVKNIWNRVPFEYVESGKK